MSAFAVRMMHKKQNKTFESLFCSEQRICILALGSIQDWE